MPMRKIAPESWVVVVSARKLQNHTEMINLEIYLYLELNLQQRVSDL
jgi:hypothetical protein